MLTDAETLEFVGMLFACFSTGWCLGFLLHVWKRVTENF